MLVSKHGREQLVVRPQEGELAAVGFLVQPFTASLLAQAIERASVEAARLPAPSPSLTAEKRPLSGMRLLLVEDNLINQQVAQELLSSEGALVEIADNGRLGVEALAQAPQAFDAVLMDLQMPEMDGLEASRVIRNKLGLTTLPIIAITANAMASDRQACLAAGMNDHIGKPFNLAHLVATLRCHTGWSSKPD